MQYPSSQNSLKNICSIILKRCLRLVLEKKFKKNKNRNKDIEAKDRVKLRIFSEGRRQDFLSDHIAFQNRSKKLRMLEITTSI